MSAQGRGLWAPLGEEHVSPDFLLTPLERRTPSVHWPLEEAVGFDVLWPEAWGQLVCCSG